MSVNIDFVSEAPFLTESYREILTRWLDSLLLEAVPEGGVVNLIVGDNRLLQELNRKYRLKDQPTDVLSFSYLDDLDDSYHGEDEKALGEIYISLEKAVAQAEEAKHSYLREIAFLSLHGMLHILGYGHDDHFTEKTMRDKEKEIMKLYDLLAQGSDHDS